MSTRTSKCDVNWLIILLLTVILETFFSFTLSLAIPQPHAPPLQLISLISDPQVDGYHSGSVDGDKKSPAVRSDLNDDHNRISYDENSPSSDTEVIIFDGVEVGEGSEEGVDGGVGGQAISVGQDTNGYNELSTESDKEFNQINTETPPPARFSWRPPLRTEATADNGVLVPPQIGLGRNKNNDQTNSSISGDIPEVPLSAKAKKEEVGRNNEEIIEELNSSGGECILGSSDVYLAWWINNDGSLRKTEPEPKYESDHVTVSNFIDLSGMARTEGNLFYKLLQRLNDKRSVTSDIPIKFLSLARNNLARAPYSTLNLIGNTLEYLSLAGNNFGMLNASIIKDDWATFPSLELLKELDLRSCKIASIEADAFSDMQMLQKMYLSNNNLISLSAEIFSSVSNLIHLDLSYNTIQYTMTNFYTNPFEWFTRGLDIDENAFQGLSKLKFLDFSHTRLEPSSMKSFLYLPTNLEQLSLCYTAITVIGLGMFHNLPNLKVLDLSGNSALTGNLNQNTFDGLQNSLEILAFENSSVKHLDWLGNLNSLKMLKLNDNNINQLTKDTFERLPSLDVLDLSYNHVGNWFNRVFESNEDLRIVNLRSNNINVITQEMMNDFAGLQYLGLANNNFICNCLLRDLIDQALQNANSAEGQGYAGEIPNINDLLITQVLINYLNNIGLEQQQQQSGAVSRDSGGNCYDSYKRVLKSYVMKGIQSYQKIRTSTLAAVNADTITLKDNQTRTIKLKPRKHYVLKSHRKRPTEGRGGKAKRSLDGTDAEVNEDLFLSIDYSVYALEFNFQLLDFEDEYYVCFNTTTNEEYYFSELESCLMERVAVWHSLVQQLRPHQRRISVALYIIFVLMLVICICYYKWWYIRYFFILIKNATILSFLNKESTDNGSRKSFGEISRADAYLYDVFVSYCDENREWVINELLPNIEQRQEISICLHERDFLVGVSILENIIACMDRSKCLLLVVSQSFLLSQWCQFEMHLAQHRLLETCRERLVLILLEDIPKRKRPKTLGYLMKTKTYIKWPLGPAESSRSVAEERKVFWKRLRRALIETDWESDAN